MLSKKQNTKDPSRTEIDYEEARRVAEQLKNDVKEFLSFIRTKKALVDNVRNFKASTSHNNTADIYKALEIPIPSIKPTVLSSSNEVLPFDDEIWKCFVSPANEEDFVAEMQMQTNKSLRR